MKLKEKINLIRNEFISETPNIDIKNILDKTPVNNEPASLPSSHKIFHFKLIFKAAFATCLLFFIGLFSYGLLKNGTSKDSISYEPNADAPMEYGASYQSYGFAASSLITVAIQNEATFVDVEPLNNDLLVNDEIDFLNNHLYLVETILSTNNIQSFQREQSDKSGYENLISYQGIDALNDNVNYKIYYQETKVNEAINNIDFLVQYKDKDYQLQGIKQTTSASSTLNLTYFINDNKDFVKLINYNDAKSNTYQYQIVKDNKIISNSKLTLLNQDNNVIVNLENVNELYQSSIFTITKNIDYESKLNVSYKILSKTIVTAPNDNQNGEYNDNQVYESGSINISVNSNIYSYSIESNNSIETITKDRLNN